MRALRLLVHAEVEEFLENLCKLLASDLEKQCEHSRSATDLKSKIYRDWGASAAKNSLQAVANNNGVKKSNIKNLFQPIGFCETDFDYISPVFLDKMTQFGSRRGDVAHKSALRATYAITAQGERQLLNEVMSHIESFCKEVHRRRLIGFY